MFSAPKHAGAHLGLAVVLLFPACGGGDAGGSGGSGSGSSGEEESESTGETGGDLPASGALAEVCEEAVVLAPGRYSSSLRASLEDAVGACGLGGPQLFFAVEPQFDADIFVEIEAEGFSPRFEWRSPFCEDGSSYACTDTSGAFVSDLRAGTQLFGSVGIDPADEALLDDGELLEFVLDLDLRPVVGAGEACGPHTLARCRAGSYCGIADDGYERCVAVPGDTCARAFPLSLPDPGGQIELTLDREGNAQHLGDHHHHSCGGTRMVDWVYRLDRAEVQALVGLPGEHRLELTSASPGVLAAVRAPGCSGASESSCAGEISTEGYSLDPADWVDGPDGDVYLFVELPIDLEGVISLQLAVVDA